MRNHPHAAQYAENRRPTGWLGLNAAGECPVGDHVLVLGRVINGKVLDAAATPMIYQDTGAMDGAAALFPSDFA